MPIGGLLVLLVAGGGEDPSPIFPFLARHQLTLQATYGSDYYKP